jgi:hypothetical protein
MRCGIQGKKGAVVVCFFRLQWGDSGGMGDDDWASLVVVVVLSCKACLRFLHSMEFLDCS